MALHHGGERRDAVAEVGLGERADADAAAELHEAAQLVGAAVRAVHGGDAGEAAGLLEQQLERPLAVDGAALAISCCCSSTWMWKGSPWRRDSASSPRSSASGTARML